jgi:hypothetical protein
MWWEEGLVGCVGGGDEWGEGEQEVGRGERVGRCGGRGEGGERDRRRSEGRECGGEIGGNGGN